MNTLATLFCILCTTICFGQSPLLHLESHILKKKNTEYFGSLADMSMSKKMDKTTFINFNSVITLNGVDDYFKVNQEIPDLKQMTIFTVFLPSENSNENYDIWGIQTENSIYSMTNTIADNAINQLEYDGIKNGKVAIHCYTQYYNVGADDYTDGSTFITFGKNEHQNNNCFKGAIAELKLYNKILSQNDRSKVISSLAIKYGISLKGDQNYLSSDNQIIWDAINDKTYNNQITGIGRDDNLKLYQKQSTSSENPKFLTIGVDAIQRNNNDNLGAIKDKYFMLWGNNGNELTLNPLSDSASTKDKATSSNIQTLNRNWLMNVTGDTEDDIATQVKIDASKMLNDSITSYLLIIDESATGNFNKENTRTINPTSITEDGIITYDNVQWDKDGSGKDIFSFRTNDKSSIEEEVAIYNELINSTATLVQKYDIFPSISTDGNFKVQVQLEKEQDLTIQVLDMNGKLISKQKYKNQKMYLLDGVPIKTDGIYNIVLTVGEEQITKKIVVEN